MSHCQSTRPYPRASSPAAVVHGRAVGNAACRSDRRESGKASCVIQSGQPRGHYAALLRRRSEPDWSRFWWSLSIRWLFPRITRRQYRVILISAGPPPEYPPSHRNRLVSISGVSMAYSVAIYGHRPVTLENAAHDATQGHSGRSADWAAPNGLTACPVSPPVASGGAVIEFR